VSKFTLGGWRKVSGGSFTDTYHHWYLAESRSPILQDRSLCGAYQFTTSTWVEKHCYAKGLLVWYRNEGVRDNNTYFHPGQGEILPVDSHPNALITPDGKFYWSGRWQAWDAPFSVDPQEISLTQAGVGAKKYRAEPVKAFSDSSTTAYWNPQLPYNSVKTAGSGVELKIMHASPDRTSYTVRLDTIKKGPPPPPR
jgi:immune inhibitor A